MGRSLSALLDLNYREARQDFRSLHFQGRRAAFEELLADWAQKRQRRPPVQDLADPLIARQPYSPVLEALRQHFGQLELPSDFWADLGMFPFHESILRDWMARRVVPREDPPLRESLRYEKAELFNAIVRSIELLSRLEPFDLVVANAQFLGPEAVELLSQLLTRRRLHGLLVLHFDWDQVSAEQQNQAYLDDFRTEIWVKQGFLDLPPAHSPASPPEPAPEPAPAALSAQALLDAMASCRNFLAAEQGLAAVAALNETAPENPLTYASLHFHWAWFLHHLETSTDDETSFRMEEAVLHYQLSADACASHHWQAEALLNLSSIALEKLDHATAQELALKAVEAARKHKQELPLARALLFYHMANSRRGLDESTAAFEECLSLLKAKGCESLLLAAWVNCIPVSRFADAPEKARAYIEQGLDLAVRLRHVVFQATLLHLKGIIVSLGEDGAQALPYYEQGLALRVGLGELRPIIQLQNGIAYTYLNQGDAQTAFEYLKRSSLLLAQIRDFNEVTITLYNLAMLYVQGRCFGQALPIIHRILQIMHILGMRGLPFNSLSDVALFQALCSLKRGELLLASGFANRLEDQVGDISPRNLPYYALFLMLLQERQPSRETVLPELDWPTLCRDRAVREHVHPYFELESGLLLLRQGQRQAGRAKLEAGLAKAKASGTGPYQAWFQAALATEREPPPLELGESPCELDRLVELARQQLNLNNLLRKMRDIQFANRAMEQLARSSVESELVADFLKLLAQHRIGIGASCLILDGGSPRLSSLPGGAGAASLGEMGELLAARIHGLVQPGDKRRLGLERFASCLFWPLEEGGKTLGGLFFAAPADRPFSNTDRDLFSILVTNLALKIQGLRHTQEIEDLARIDSLSQLGNRKGLFHRLALEQGRLGRFRRFPPPAFSVCFIDLDNFKYYNDSFGHQAGDYLIRRVGELLRQCFRESDYLARYGGDEFVILLPDTRLEAAELPAYRFLAELLKQQGFAKELAGIAGKPIQIPPEFFLSASIGLADLEALPLPEKRRGVDLEALIRMADHALYQAKEAGKSRIIRAPAHG